MAAISMGSIPHNPSETTTSAHGTPTALLWALLFALLLGVVGVMGYRATHGSEILHKPEVVAAARPSLEPTQTPAVFNQEAEPLADNPVPRYPAEMLADGTNADVVVRLQIDANGAVTEATLQPREDNVDERFEQAALQALREWRFRPEVREGHAISSVVLVPVEFRR